MFLFTFCGTKSDKELYDSAKNLLAENKYSESLAEFEKILEEYPESEYTSKVIFEMAKIYGGNFLTDVPSKEALEKSVNYYKLIYEKYPQSAEAPNSLFMTAFIQANYLNQLEVAKENYNTFIEKYPANELVPSAKAELQTLGISPEEILKISRQEAK